MAVLGPHKLRRVNVAARSGLAVLAAAVLLMGAARRTLLPHAGSGGGARLPLPRWEHVAGDVSLAMQVPGWAGCPAAPCRYTEMSDGEPDWTVSGLFFCLCFIYYTIVFYVRHVYRRPVADSSPRSSQNDWLVGATAGGAAAVVRRGCCPPDRPERLIRWAASSTSPLPQVPWNSQFGEDAWLVHNLLWRKRNGFFLEVGRSLPPLQSRRTPALPVSAAHRGAPVAKRRMACYAGWPPVLEDSDSAACSSCLPQQMGAMDGVSLSNTLWLHRAAGWRGLLVEACPGTAPGWADRGWRVWGEEGVMQLVAQQPSSIAGEHGTQRSGAKSNSMRPPPDNLFSRCCAARWRRHRHALAIVAHGLAAEAC
jgi:hypothetical protein